MASQEDVKSRYARIELPLDAAQVDQEIEINGDYLSILSFTGTNASTWFKLNHRHNSEIRPGEQSEIYSPYNRIFLTNSAESGKKLILGIGSAFVGELKPSSSQKSQLMNSGGTVIDPAQEDGNLSTLLLYELLDTANISAIRLNTTLGQGYENLIQQNVTAIRGRADLDSVNISSTKYLTDLYLPKINDNTSDLMFYEHLDTVNLSSIQHVTIDNKTILTNIYGWDADIGNLSYINKGVDDILVEVANSQGIFNTVNSSNLWRTQERATGAIWSGQFNFSTNGTVVSGQYLVLRNMVLYNESGSNIWVGNSASNRSFPIPQGGSLGMEYVNAGEFYMVSGANATIHGIGVTY
jgi:hypothetical protein